MEPREKFEKTKQPVETLKVLIADDDPPTRLLLRAAISQWGYQIIEAKDGEEAWDILQLPDPPHLLIVDWLMPNLDGLELCKRIKNELAYHPYSILLTQVSGVTNIIKGLDAGADEFLSKPFNMAELRSRLSVGARIVKFKIKLDLQNKQLKTYIEQMEKLSQQVQQLSAQLAAILKDEANLGTSKEITTHFQMLKETEANINKLVAMVTKFQSDKEPPIL